MSAHTLGPWHFGGVFLPGTPDVHVTVWSAPKSGDQSGDEVAKYVHPRDAGLIAAAPSLLAAAQSVERLLLIAELQAKLIRLRARLDPFGEGRYGIAVKDDPEAKEWQSLEDERVALLAACRAAIDGATGASS